MSEEEEIEVEAVQVMKKSLKLRTVSENLPESSKAATNLAFPLTRPSVGTWSVVSRHTGVLRMF